MKGLAADPKNQEWWTITEPMQQPLEDRAPGEWWKAIPEVFHTD
jgi:L-rhamnose mutarotase